MPGRGSYNALLMSIPGAWRSLASVLDWGSRGRRFESCRPDVRRPLSADDSGRFLLSLSRLIPGARNSCARRYNSATVHSGENNPLRHCCSIRWRIYFVRLVLRHARPGGLLPPLCPPSCQEMTSFYWTCRKLVQALVQAERKRKFFVCRQSVPLRPIQRSISAFRKWFQALSGCQLCQSFGVLGLLFRHPREGRAGH